MVQVNNVNLKVKILLRSKRILPNTTTNVSAVRFPQHIYNPMERQSQNNQYIKYQ